MSLKPRQSVLDLFDPLLSNALRVPLPDTPPLTPVRLSDEENQENKSPDDLMVLFLNHFSEKKGTFSSRRQRSELLVDIEEEDTEIIDMEPLQHQQQDFTPAVSEGQSSLDSTISSHPDNTESKDIETVIPVLVYPDTTTESSTFPVDKQAKPRVGDYLHLPSQSHNRRRSSTDIAMALSSFSSSLMELPGSDIDLIKEELSPLSEDDSSQCLDEIGALSFSAQEVERTTTTQRPEHFNPTDYLAIPESKTPQEKHLQSSSIGSFHSTNVTPNHLSDTSNCQPINSKEISSKKPLYPSSSNTGVVVSAPRRPKVFTVNRQQVSFKPDMKTKSDDRTEDIKDGVLKTTSGRPIVPMGNKTSGSAPGRTIPRLHRGPIVKQAIPLESRIPSRVATSENTNQFKPTATIKTFGGASRIAVPLKKVVRRAAS